MRKLAIVLLFALNLASCKTSDSTIIIQFDHLNGLKPDAALLLNGEKQIGKVTHIEKENDNSYFVTITFSEKCVFRADSYFTIANINRSTVAVFFDEGQSNDYVDYNYGDTIYGTRAESKTN